MNKPLSYLNNFSVLNQYYLYRMIGKSQRNSQIMEIFDIFLYINYQELLHSVINIKIYLNHLHYSTIWPYWKNFIIC